MAACLVSVTLAAVAEPLRKTQPEPESIGSRLELFVDGRLIESLEGARLKLHSPRPAERVLFFDREWEGGNSGYVTVFRDGGRYRMYYRGASSKGYAVPSLLKAGDRIEIQDAHGRPFPGFSLEESPLIWGDEIERMVRWKRTHPQATLEKPLAHLAGDPVRLRLVMKDADLYSFGFR